MKVKRDDEPKLGNVSNIIFNDDSIDSFETLGFPITDMPAKFSKKPKLVPTLNLDNLGLRKEHYFSKSSNRILDLTVK